MIFGFFRARAQPTARRDAERGIAVVEVRLHRRSLRRDTDRWVGKRRSQARSDDEHGSAATRTEQGWPLPDCGDGVAGNPFEQPLQQLDQAFAVGMQKAEVACAPAALGQDMVEQQPVAAAPDCRASLHSSYCLSRSSLMNMTHAVCIFALLIGHFSESLSAPSSAPPIVVQRQSLLCVIDNVKIYQSSKANPVIIILDRCPQLDVTESDLLDNSENYLPTLQSESKSGNAAITNVVSFTKKELECLKKIRRMIVESSEKTVSLPPKICKG